jgi:hypothetical protein
MNTTDSSSDRNRGFIVVWNGGAPQGAPAAASRGKKRRLSSAVNTRDRFKLASVAAKLGVGVSVYLKPCDFGKFFAPRYDIEGSGYTIGSGVAARCALL